METKEELKENERICVDCKCKIVFHTDQKIEKKKSVQGVLMNRIKLFFMRLRTRKYFGKYGLKGNDGFTKCGTYFNANYDFNGDYFIELEFLYSDYEKVLTWTRIDKKKYLSGIHKIINCTYCNSPAVTLDHSWPYLIGMTMCADCFAKYKRKELEIIDG